MEPDEPDALERDDNPHSVLGQLRLGRGAGWLRTASEGDGPELLRAALSREPRWDRQLEHGADYYATLAIELGLSSLDLDLDEVCLDEDARQLGLEVFGRLAVRGDDAAIAVLQQEFSRPENEPDNHWTLGSTLAAIPAGKGLVGLCPLLVRPRDDAELADLVETTSELPWAEWALSDLRVARALAQVEREAEHDRRAREAVRPPPVDAPVAELLSFAWPGRPPSDVVDRLAATCEIDEIRRVREAATGPWGPTRRFALTVLAARSDPTALDLAARVFASGESGWERGALVHYFRSLPGELTLPRAREWLELDDDRWSGVAAAVVTSRRCGRRSRARGPATGSMRSATSPRPSEGSLRPARSLSSI